MSCSEVAPRRPRVGGCCLWAGLRQNQILIILLMLMLMFSIYWLHICPSIERDLSSVALLQVVSFSIKVFLVSPEPVQGSKDRGSHNRADFKAREETMFVILSSK